MNVIIANKYKEMLMALDIEVIKSIEGVYDAEDIINNFSNFYFDRMILDITAIKDYQNIDNLQKLSINLDMNKVILLLDDSEESSSKSYLSKLISMGIYNFTRNSEGIKYLLTNPNSYRDVAHLHVINENTDNIISDQPSNSKRIIGVKSLTEGAGASTLIYMMKKQLSENYMVCALEVDKYDFVFFDDKEMTRVDCDSLPKELMKKRDYNIVLVDLNDYIDPDICSDVLYLVEPSTIKLNRLLTKNKRVFEEHKNDKIVLTKSFISNNDLMDFEYETKSNVYYNLPALDERKNYNEEINGLLSKMGFIRQGNQKEESGKNKLLGMFKI